MTSRRALTLLFLIVGIAGLRGEEPKSTEADGRVVEGMIATAERRPIQGASVLFGQADGGFAFAEGAMATTDAQGRYRADLTKFPWSTGAMRALVLAPGFEAAERTVAAGARASTADFEIKARPWKETRIRLEDGSGRPVADVEVTCSVGSVSWARLRTDAEGCCRIAMAPEIWIGLTAKPEGARPIKATIAVTEGSPGSIRLPVVPPYRGRVLDPEGRPVPNAVVGSGWITKGEHGEWRMGPFYRETVTTNREGHFELAPVLEIRDYGTRLGPPEVEPLCFADASFRRVAFRALTPGGAKDPIEVTLRPARRVRVPVATGSIAPDTNALLSTEIKIVPRPERPDWRFYFLLDEQPWKELPDRPAGGKVIEEYLPGGTYRIDVGLYEANGGGKLGEATRELVVPSGEGPLDLPPIELRLTVHREMVGKPAPEIEAIDLDTGRPVTLADYRGKVVILDFWGYWCGPCVGNMPHLVELQRKFAGRPLEILALHDQSVQSRAEYDRKIAAARRHFWGGHDLPFRVALDRPDPRKSDERDPIGSGTTIERYEIKGFPTVFVIDRDGTIVDQVWFSDHERLESLVRKLLEKAEAR